MCKTSDCDLRWHVVQEVEHSNAGPTTGLNPEISQSAPIDKAYNASPLRALRIAQEGVTMPEVTSPQTSASDRELVVETLNGAGDRHTSIYLSAE